MIAKARLCGVPAQLIGAQEGVFVHKLTRHSVHIAFSMLHWLNSKPVPSALRRRHSQHQRSAYPLLAVDQHSASQTLCRQRSCTSSTPRRF